MRGIEEEAQAQLEAYISANKALGVNFKRPDGMGQLAVKAAELDLEKDMGLLGEWREVSCSSDWSFTDARLLRSARLDAAEAKYRSAQASRFAWYAMSSAAKTYYACFILIVLNLGQFGLIWWLLARQS
ncbi:hypothetical protein PE067_11845 [Paracoccus sp. DMF-8]|uniref:hypothetical protein n=1 Tax=Paracoccus sp. DMF-8 TaxID=3019445 RepID=UPI0023E7A586|nr:hypothetical protein [Paracoccus sp. DMF-8]MDF3606759.1 hypothetical protein [Paracoccus sp. DMF-8]